MPIISFSSGDKLAAITAEAGWYEMVLTKCDAKASTSGKSQNYWCTFQIQGGKYDTKEIDQCFNSESNGSSVLGTLIMFPASDILVLAAAIADTTLKDVDLNVDTEQLLHVLFSGQVDITIADNRPLNRVINYKPTGSTAEANKATF